MKRLGKTLPERLGSVALRYGAPLAHPASMAPVRPAWEIVGDAEQDAPIGDGPTARTERQARLEAILFLAREPLGTRKLAQLADLADGTEARTLIRKLNGLLDEEDCAFRLVEVAGGFQLMSRPQFAPYLRRIHGPSVEVRLSAPAMETLSVVAYRQPVLRATIESIRGVQCGELLRQLMERDLVRIAGRSEDLGRPFLYGTTKRFLQVFGLRHIDELPPVEGNLIADEPQEAAAEQPPLDDEPDARESRLTEEESTVKIEIEGQEDKRADELTPAADTDQAPAVELEDAASFEESFDEEEYEYEDDEEDDYDDESDDDFDEEDYDEEEYEEEEYEEEEDEDDGFEDSEWEEVEDEDVDAGEDDEEWEEEEWEEGDEEEDVEWEEEEVEEDDEEWE